MTISEIYSTYKIPPHLQLHMLRVAAVAKVICDSMTIEVDEQSVVTACLLHDIGNIIKFNFSVRPQDFQPEGIGYWQKVKDEYITKYGNDENIATEIILQELGVSKSVLDVYSHIGFGRAPIVLEIDDYNFKIANYADQRIGPDGVMTMLDRLQEGRKRYFANKGDVADPVFFDNNVRRLEMIEEQIFSKSRINSVDINESVIIPVVEDLRSFEV
jgi:hypothetical protein